MSIAAPSFAAWDHARPGVWMFTDDLDKDRAVSLVTRLEALGYSSLFVPETTGRDPFAHLAALGEHTSRLVLATGIASIFNRHPGSMQQVSQTLAEQVDGRFLLGLGVSHAPMVEGLRKLDYSRPRSQMQQFLEAMDASPYSGAPPQRPPARVLAALGPKMLELAATAADGAHTYFVTPDHTAQARQALGPDKILAVEQKVVLETAPARARDLARVSISRYARLPNYRKSWSRLGFTDADIEDLSDRLVDGLVAWGTVADLQARIRGHYDAGATHVCLQPVVEAGDEDARWAVLEALAPGAG